LRGCGLALGRLFGQFFSEIEEGEPLENLWRASGEPLENLWRASGGPLESLWRAYGEPLESLFNQFFSEIENKSLWISSRQPLEILSTASLINFTLKLTKEESLEEALDWRYRPL